jgi:UDP:flavonoid glycosyltransferase YjiC (YdhE family)
MRWLLTSWGSRGDLHPFLALGRGLLARGHEVSLVGHPEWGGETAAAGIRFVSTHEPLRDDFLRRHPAILSMRWGGLASLHALVRHGMAPGFDQVLVALLAEAPAHDVIVAHHFVFPAPVAAELSAKPWATVSLAPGVVPSDYTRPGTHFGRAGSGIFARRINRFIWAGGKLVTRAVVDPRVNALRRRNGLPRVRDAVFGHLSPRLNLQLYSGLFAPPTPDWSPEKRPGGFCFYDPPDAALSPEVEAFLEGGEPPILFTLGSAAVQAPGSFYREAVAMLGQTGRRGLLLIGPEENRPASLPRTILAVPYAPYGPLMPRVRAVVHQSGIGTLSHVLRAGVPSVACPFAFDQPNNARRLEALGVAEVVLPRQREAEFMARALERLLAGEAPTRAARLGERLRAEDGVGRSCDVLEEVFGRDASGV